MIYAYDLLVNPSDKLYDFYDWEENDSFLHLRRAPLIKVNYNDYYNFLSKKIKVDNEFLLTIKDKTQIFALKSIDTILYAGIFTNGENAVLLIFDSLGFVNQKSKFLVNEELEVVELSDKMKCSLVNYTIVNESIHRNNMTRKENLKIRNIINDISLIKNDKEKISYLYYECFGEKKSRNKYNELINGLKNGSAYIHEDFLDILNILIGQSNV